MQFVGKLVLRLLEFTHGLSHALGQFGQLLRAEKHEDDQQNDDQVRAAKVGQQGEQIHNVVGTSLDLPRLQALSLGKYTGLVLNIPPHEVVRLGLNSQ